ncbi:hypothetical protein P8452_19328 [Trifolium repens]|nr:hypothetical protein P8452_19328 [Trifolium repens]
MSIFNVFWVINIISLQVFLANSYCTKSLVPALYVFGDSTVDAGNNNNLNTDAKVNRFPYGIDFNNVSTGRFSNGKTFADILAIKLGLPMPPPYLGVSTTERYQIASGINYASGSCGILIPLKNLDSLILGTHVLGKEENLVKIGMNIIFTILPTALKPQSKYMQISVLVEDICAFLSILRS